MDPRVTVIIPTYNWAPVLPYSIGSVLGQTFGDFELLVIGDGCTDESESVVRAIGDARVRWVNIPRFGHQSGPNNEGIRQARGSIVAYLGHDDLWLPHHLSTMVAALDAGADLVHSMFLAVHADGRLDVFVPEPGGWAPPSATAHRRNVVERAGEWRHFRGLAVTPEYDFWSRVRSAGCRSAIVPRLTAIKFPAGFRRNVYRERPCHEQAAWLARIQSEPDFEAVELGKVVQTLKRRGSAPVRAWLLATQPWRWREWVANRFFKRADRTIELQRRFKGIED